MKDWSLRNKQHSVQFTEEELFLSVSGDLKKNMTLFHMEESDFENFKWLRYFSIKTKKSKRSPSILKVPLFRASLILLWDKRYSFKTSFRVTSLYQAGIFWVIWEIRRQRVWWSGWAGSVIEYTVKKVGLYRTRQLLIIAGNLGWH